MKGLCERLRPTGLRGLRALRALRGLDVAEVSPGSWRGGGDRLGGTLLEAFRGGGVLLLVVEDISCG